jgi:hypothetical protein
VRAAAARWCRRAQAAAELYRPYGATFSLDRCYDLAVHHDQATGVVVLEYASHGRAIPTGTAYSNRCISRRIGSPGRRSPYVYRRAANNRQRQVAAVNSNLRK